MGSGVVAPVTAPAFDEHLLTTGTLADLLAQLEDLDLEHLGLADYSGRVAVAVEIRHRGNGDPVAFLRFGKHLTWR